MTSTAPAPSEERGLTSQGWTRLDRILRAVTVLVLLVSCLLGSAQKDIWLDEGFTLQLLTDRSLPHMMHALANAADGGMPLYYLLAYAWGSIFGTALLSLRLFSSLFVCAGVLLLWSTLRKCYSVLAVALSIAATTITSGLLLHQNAEARYYGFFFACAALVFAMHFHLTQEPQPSRKLIACAIAAHVALLMSHPFGMLYSAMAIAALVFSDHRWGKLRWRVYVALAASWLVLLLWIAPMVRLHDVAVPHNWPQPPTFVDVLTLYAFGSPCLAFAILFAIGLSALAPARDKQEQPSDSSALLACAVAYLIPPLIVAMISLGDSSLFVDRYFIPSLIGVAALVASLFESRLRAVKLNVAFEIAWLLVFLAFLSWPILAFQNHTDTPLRMIDQNLPPNTPMIVTEGQVFLNLTYLSNRPSRPYYYPLDWNSAVHSPTRAITVIYKLLNNAKAAGYASDRILDAEQLRCSFDHFFVLDHPGYGWFQQRIVRNPDYTAQHIGDLPHDLQIWSVKRLPGGTSCPK